MNKFFAVLFVTSITIGLAAVTRRTISVDECFEIAANDTNCTSKSNHAERLAKAVFLVLAFTSDKDIRKQAVDNFCSSVIDWMRCIISHADVNCPGVDVRNASWYSAEIAGLQKIVDRDLGCNAALNASQHL